MTDAEKIEMAKAMSGESDGDAVSAYLKIAAGKLTALTDSEATVDKLPMLHVEAAVYLLNKRGGEGEVGHSENGISRTYESADLPPSLLRSYGILGICKAVT